VGKKTAQKILFQLQDRIKAVDGLEPVAAMSEVDAEVLDALTTLGYSVVEGPGCHPTYPARLTRGSQRTPAPGPGLFRPPLMISSEEKCTLLMNIPITFIGPGVMAEAMIAGLIRRGMSDPR
jgi:hypothetical protein